MALSAVIREWGRRRKAYHSLLIHRLLPPPPPSFASFSTGGDGNGDGDGFQSSRVEIFDRDLKRKQRDRAAWLMRGKDDFADSVADNLLDRLEDCKKMFPTALCFGGSSGAIRRLLRGRGGIEKLIMMDMSFDMVKKLKESENDSPNDNLETSFVVGDEEFLPIKESSVDLVVSCLGLHWTNDLPGAMIQVRDAGNLLTRAGFTLPGVDVDQYTIKYNSALELVEHLRAMGETNALFQRSTILKRDTALATAAVYQSMFGAEDGTVPATFQVIYMTGWREHPSQQKAKRRGSATVSFKDIQKQFGSSG
ncbi:putative methyltransferase At1g22800, mitochondrial isoform X3 [Typha latifolia]|uniref:putative methyltransferase At1g22800, mitochondrial isoform X3 n=1 Tax=Typha latifolia TaxID=4733 RepID=UPI003C2BB05B